MTVPREPSITIVNGKREPDELLPLTTSEAGDPSACFLLWRELHDLAVIGRFTTDGEPVSKSRARFTKRGSKAHAYTPEKTTQAEQLIGWKFRQAVPGHKLDIDATYGVMALFFCGTRQRRDVDNMLKLILDGLNKVAWPDDEQVIEVSARKALTSRENARTEVIVYRVGDVQRFTLQCEQCGRDFPTYPSWEKGTKKRYCSATCGHDARREQKTQDCAHCGKSFVRAKVGTEQPYCSKECGSSGRRATVACCRCGIEFTKQRCHVRVNNYCSTECRNTQAREQRAKNAKGTCETCGGPTTKKTYRQCQACRWSGMLVSGKPATA